jgi:DNA-binding IclR family transcriptional regulator
MSDLTGGIHRTIVLLRHLATADGRGRRLKDIADAAGLPRPTTHRILASLIAEGMVERDAGAKVYRLGLDLFMLAARAGNPMNLRELCRPALLRLTGSLGETIFVLVRSGFDAVCIDRTAGPLPIRSFTGDIGGSVMLGIGQGAMAILAHLTPGEQDEVIRYNLPRMRDYAGLDEAFLRAEMARVRARGFCDDARRTRRRGAKCWQHDGPDDAGAQCRNCRDPHERSAADRRKTQSIRPDAAPRRRSHGDCRQPVALTPALPHLLPSAGG